MTILQKCEPTRASDQKKDSGRCCVLSFRGLEKGFGGQSVLAGADNDLHAGEVVLLRGDNGSGKTTLLNILTGNLEPDAGTIHLRPNGQEETFRFPRKWWESLNPFDHFTPERVASEAVGRTWQDVRLFPTLTLSDNIAVAKQRQPGESPWRALLPGQSASETSNNIASSTMLANLGLADREGSSGDKISLGQSKRVAIARAVQAGARILFLDEPLSGLDGAGIEDVLDLLSSLARNERLTLVIVEHTFYIPRVLEFANSVWTLTEGRIHVQTPAEVRAEYGADAKGGAIAHVAMHLGSSFYREEIDLYRGAHLTRFYPKNESDKRPVLLEVRDLLVPRGPRLVIGNQASNGQIEGLSFKLRRGDFAVLQAPNGWGKTTLLEAIAGLTRVIQGEILLGGVAIHEMSPWKRVRRGLTVLPSRNHLFGSLTVAEMGILSGTKRPKTVDSYQLDTLSDRRISSLSGGERQRLGIASLPAGQVGIYDEPFSALDSSSLQLFLRTNGIQRTESVLVLLPRA